jgi:hypothetical protein
MNRNATPSRRRRLDPALIAVVSVVTALAVWRLAYVFAGPDPDTDAYGHHVIARHLVDAPGDLAAHWVWLPLFHYVQAIGIALFGLTLQHVRIANVAISAATPIALYFTLRSIRARATSGGHFDGAVPAIAAIVAALSPIAMQMGTTGQTEPIFALLTVAMVWCFVVDRPWLASMMLTASVLIRYEAWAIACALPVAIVVEAAFEPKKRARLRDPKSWLPVAMPFVAIAAWAILRRPVDGGWFVFLHGTQRFATDALGTKSTFSGDLTRLWNDVTYYSITVPWRCVGYPLVLAPFGIARVVRREGLRFCAVFSAILAFVTLTWIARGSLGLDRHFVAIVPLYATLIAEGIVQLAQWIERLVAPPARLGSQAFLASRAFGVFVLGGLATATFATSAQLLVRWMGDWRRASEESWVDRREIAAELRETSKGLIFCDEPTIEVLSGLPRERFDRRSTNDDDGARRLVDAASRDGVAYVVAWAPNAKRALGLGTLAYRPPWWTHETYDGLLLVRVDARFDRR